MATAAKTKTKRPAKKAAQTGNIHDREYEAFLTSLSFSVASKAGNAPVFRTDVEPDVLWKTYLRAFKPTERKFHNCSACRSFIKHYGNLVTIDADGLAFPLVWLNGGVPKEYATAFAACYKLVRKADVVGVFYAKEKTWGTPLTSIWRHMATPAPAQALKPNAGPAMAEKREDFATVLRALEEFPPALVDRAVELLDTADLYRSEKILGQAQWLADLHRARRDAAFKHLRANLTWYFVAKAPAGFCHPRSSMIGTLLEDLASGMSTERAKERFEAKMDPLRYQRPQAPPSEQNILRAEKLVEELGLALALERRYARLDEVDALWHPTYVQPSSGVFSHLRSRVPAPVGFMGAGQKMTWTKFRRDVLPHAEHMYICIPPNGNFAAITTAVHAEAAPLLQWDSPAGRNPFGWYVYTSGSPASQWGLSYNDWVRVNAVCLQPSQWYRREDDFAHQGHSAFFLLEGARDSNRPSAALFPEMLRSELREVRATIEAHSRSSTPSGREHATACGIRTDNAGSLGAPLWVVTRSGQGSVYIVDRWE